MSRSDIHVTCDESFEGFRSMASSKIVEGFNNFSISSGAGHRHDRPSKRIYWVHGIPDISESLIIHGDSHEYLKLNEMIENIEESGELTEFLKDDGSIQKYCEEIYYQQMIKKHGLQVFIYQMRVLAYQRGLKEGIEQNRKALREAFGL